MLESRPAVGAHNNEIDGLPTCSLNDFRGGVPESRQGFCVEVLALQFLCQCGELFGRVGQERTFHAVRFARSQIDSTQREVDHV